MARKYRTVDGLGRCTITLHGFAGDRRIRMLVARQESTKRFFLVINEGRRQQATPATSLPPSELLRLIAEYSLAIDAADESHVNPIDQFVAGK